jgi:dolichol-phosphate mannosyltransferase
LGKLTVVSWVAASAKPLTYTVRFIFCKKSQSMNSNPVPELSVVVPVHNEQDNVATLIGEIAGALRGRLGFEMLFVDDASRDETLRRLQALKDQFPELRVIAHRQQAGQSTAVRSGIKQARGAWIATLDGDGQNDPADIPALWTQKQAATDANLKMFAGWRTTRRDDGIKRWSSKIANGVRSRMLGDGTPDTGCGLKLFERSAFLDLPYFSHMHRYLPALMQRAGWRVASVPVGHRPRLQGQSKYGVWNRLWVGIVDMFGVAWLKRRSRPTDVTEL